MPKCLEAPCAKLGSGALPDHVGCADLRYEFDAARGVRRTEDLDAARVNADRADKISRDHDDLPLDQRGQLLHVLALISFREAQSHFDAGADRDRVAANQSCESAIEYWRQAAMLGDGAPPRIVQGAARATLPRRNYSGSICLAMARLIRARNCLTRPAELFEGHYARRGVASLSRPDYRALLTRAKPPPADEAGGPIRSYRRNENERRTGH